MNPVICANKGLHKGISGVNGVKRRGGAFVHGSFSPHLANNLKRRGGRGREDEFSKELGMKGEGSDILRGKTTG